MPAIPFASFHGPVDGVRKLHKKRQFGTPKPPARVGFPMGNPSYPYPEPEDLPIQLGDPDEEIPGSGISDSPTIFAGLPTAPITVTLISTVTDTDPAPTLSVPASVSNDPSAAPTVSASPSAPSPSAPEQSALSSDIPVASPSISVIPSSDPVPQPSDVIVEPSSVVSSVIPQPSAPVDPPQPPPPPPPSYPSSPAPSPSGSVEPVASPTAPMQSGGGIMLSDNNPPPSISGGLLKSSKMSTGAIVGIVIGIFAVLLLAGIFLARKTLLRRRRRIHIGDNMSWPEEKSFGERFAGGKTNNGTVTPYPFTAPVSTGGSGPRQHHQPQMSIARVPPPPITPSIAPPHFSSAASQPPVPPPYLNNGVLSPSVAPLGWHTVRSTFTTTLPDELNIQMGEKINVLTVYDDGWALCQRVASGEQGMAPMECLVADGTSPINIGRAGSLRSVV